MTYRLPLSGALVVGCGMASFVLVAGTAPVPVVLAVLTLLGLFLRGTIPLPRAWLLPGALILALLVFTRRAELPPESGFVGPASYNVALYFGVLVLFSLFRKNQRDEGLVLVCMAVALAMASGMTTGVFPFAFALVPLAFFLVLFLRTQLPAGRVRPGAVLSLVPIGGTAVLLIFALHWSEGRVNQLMTFIAPMQAKFAPVSKLNAILSNQSVDMVVMRLQSPAPPQYLSGRCYLTYEGRAWKWLPSKRVVEPLDTSPGAYSLPEPVKLFPVRDPQPPPWGELLAVDYIEVPGAGRGGADLMTSADAYLLAMHAPEVQADHDDIFHTPAGDDFDGSYYQVRLDGQPPVEPLSDPAPYLQLPEDLPPIVRTLALRLTDGATSDVERADRIELYLQEEHEYGFGYPFDRDRDPVEQFLTEKPPAHCEFFATSMTLMLRSLGIPSRYVAGFVVRERNPFSGYHVIRASHAHAWVEAYFPGRGWVLFDPTSDRSYRPPNAFQQWLRDVGDAVAMVLARVWKLNFKRLLLDLLTALRGALDWIMERPLLGILVLLGAVLARRQGFRWPGRRRVPAAEGVSPEDARFRKLLGDFDRELRRRGLTRLPQLTLREWSERLAAAGLEEPELEKCRTFLDRYCSARYGVLEEDHFRAMEALVEELRASLPNLNRGDRRER